MRLNRPTGGWNTRFGSNSPPLKFINEQEVSPKFLVKYDSLGLSLIELESERSNLLGIADGHHLQPRGCCNHVGPVFSQMHEPGQFIGNGLRDDDFPVQFWKKIEPVDLL